MRAFPLGLIGPLLLSVAVTGAAIWAKDGFAPIVPLQVVELDNAAIGAAKRAATPSTPVPAAAAADVDRTPPAPVATLIPADPPPAGPPEMSAQERKQLLLEYGAYYRERFKLPAMGQRVELQFRTGASRIGKFQRVDGDRVEVLLNGASISFPRGELTPRTRARFYEDEYATYMAHRRLKAK